MRKRNKTISIRCTEDEYSRVHQKAERYGLKLNEFVLKIALGKKIIVAQGLDEECDSRRLSAIISTSLPGLPTRVR